MTHLKKTAIAMAIANIAFMSSGAALAQSAGAPATAADGTAIVVVTHNPVVAARAQRRLTMKSGSVVG